MARILVIEDDPIQRLMICGVLVSGGHTLSESASGVLGLKLAHEENPDLVVCDVMMPGMSGYELVAMLRQHPNLATVPVIMLTAMTERSQVRQGMHSGADDYLTKPFRADELHQAVAALLAKQVRSRAQFARSFQDDLQAALSLQKESLALQYELRLHAEISQRWSAGGEAQTDLNYAQATVLLVDLFGAFFSHPLSQKPSAPDLNAALGHIYTSASDALYVFGASHLVPLGNDLLAVFAKPEQALSAQPRTQALRAAFGLKQALRAALQTCFKSLTTGPAAPPNQLPVSAPQAPLITAAMHVGNLRLLRVTDPLLGGSSSTLVTGEAVAGVQALRDFGREQGWPVCCSAPVLEGLAAQWLLGQRRLLPAAQANPGIEAVQVLAAAKS